MNSQFDEEFMPEDEKDENTGSKTLIRGVFIGALFAVAIMCVVFMVCVKLGYINIGFDGTIYVQQEPINSAVVGDDPNGIGSKVAYKLNVLEKGLSSFYFDDVKDEEVADKIYKAYLAAYNDKYTVYYTADEYNKIKESNSGTYYGIGVVVRKNDDGSIKVVEPYKGAPGDKAGLKVDDAIVAVNGKSILNIDLSTVVAEMKGAEGTDVELEIRREGLNETFKVKVTRAKVELKTVDSEMLDDKIGYITVGEFDTVTSSQFLDAYNDLMSQGMKGVIVDVRSNPGGMLSTVVNMLDSILPEGLIVYTEDKYGKHSEYKGNNPSHVTIPMAVLINGESASASEIFAGAIQDYGVGTLVGTKTFGKGIVQSIVPLTDGSAIKYTTSKYFTPKGQDIHGNGVRPDIEVELSDEFKNAESYDKSIDNQLQTAIKVIKEKF